MSIIDDSAVQETQRVEQRLRANVAALRTEFKRDYSGLAAGAAIAALVVAVKLCCRVLLNLISEKYGIPTAADD